jgi:hypothetical protein
VAPLPLPSHTFRSGTFFAGIAEPIIVKGRALSSSIACALLVLGFLSCAGGGLSTSSGATNAQPKYTPDSIPDERCLAIDSACSVANDCCSELCQNGYCEEQTGM